MDFGSFRAIKNETILSPSLPRLGIHISPDFVYIGKLEYLSAETYHVEQFIFLSPNGLGHATRVLLVQFAGFLGNKRGVYQYSTQKAIQIHDDEYLFEERTFDIADFIRRNPQTELAHAADYIRQRAYTLAGDMCYHRFTRLVSADGRNEFVIMYLENNCEAAEAASAESQGEPVSMLDRALGSFTIVPYDSEKVG